MSRPESLDLALTRLGAGPPVVVLHGLLGRGRNWLQIAKQLQDRFELFLVDLRNHGTSPWSDEMTYAAMAGDVAALVERERLGPVGLVGHSMGGKVAMTLAVTRPELVAHLVLADIAPVAYAGGFDAYIEGMLGLDLARMSRRAEADAALAAVEPNAGIRGFLLQNLEISEGRLSWQPNLRVLLDALPEITGVPTALEGRSFDGPTCAIRGERSAYVGPEGEAALRRHFPKAEVLTVAGAGHWLHSEQPAAFLERLAPCLGG